MFNEVVAGLAGSTIPDEIHNLSSVFQVYPVVFYKLDMSGNLFPEWMEGTPEWYLNPFPILMVWPIIILFGFSFF